MNRRKQQLIDQINNLKGVFLNLISKKNVRAYWWNRGINFGDLITPYLLERYGLKPVWSFPGQAAIVSTGSVLQHLPRDYTGEVVGSGLISDEIPSGHLMNATVHSVRGRLTLESLGRGQDGNVGFGDPGLLSSKFVLRKKYPQWKIGLVPHFVDAENASIRELAKRFPDEIMVIDVCRYPQEVWEDLANCEVILSSSLHGIICADSMSIPTAWLNLSDNVIGDGFKFRDYYSAFGEEAQSYKLRGEESLDELSGMTSTRDEDKLNSLIEGIDTLFLQFAERQKQ